MAGSADGPPQVDACAIADLTRLELHWRDLGGRAGEPNPFAESAFLIPATRHIAARSDRALHLGRPGSGEAGRPGDLAPTRIAR